MYTDKDLLYAATARCTCGKGLAHPLDPVEALRLGAWSCSAELKGELPVPRPPIDFGHQRYPFGLWKIREETSINNRGGGTTRPPDTVARTVGKATCGKCGHVWESEPYNANGLSHHWLPGACPNCGLEHGGGLSTVSGPGAPPHRIEVRFRHVVFEVTAP